MVLTKQNTGKYLTKEWNDPGRERQRCLYDSREFSSAERTYYGVTNTGVSDGLGYQVDDFCIIDNLPVDTETDARRIDRRNLPEVGH